MFWTAAMPQSLPRMLRVVLTDPSWRPVAVWARNSIMHPNHSDYNKNVRVIKDLNTVWLSPQIQLNHPFHFSGQQWGPHNTVLVDDSAYKARLQPYNLLCIPEYRADSEEREVRMEVLRELAWYLKQLESMPDVRYFLRNSPFRIGEWDGTATG